MARQGNQLLVGSEPQDGVGGFQSDSRKTAHSEPSKWEFSIKTSDHQIPRALYTVLCTLYYKHK